MIHCPFTSINLQTLMKCLRTRFKFTRAAVASVPARPASVHLACAADRDCQELLRNTFFPARYLRAGIFALALFAPP